MSQFRKLACYQLLLIVFDAWINTGIYRIGVACSNFWEQCIMVSSFFRVRGAIRFVIEILNEILTLGFIGLTVFTAVGLSVFEVTKEGLGTQDDLSVTFLDRNGNVIGQRGSISYNKNNVPVIEIPDYLIKAVLSTEDRRFFQHKGIDLHGLSRALSQNIRASSVIQGGSTLTQQLAKNLFLNNERVLKRKIKEAYLAIWLEANLSKQEILQLYLDRAYMGGGNFGITSAAEFYFDKNIRNISLAEAAMLVGLFKAPGKYAPHVHLPAARARANIVLSNLVENGLMTEGQIADARHYPAKIVTSLKYKKHPNYFLDWVFEEIRKIRHQLHENTLIVRTTLDLNLQKIAEESIEFYLTKYGKQFNVSQAATVILANDGSVRAIVGGRDYSASQFNRATQARRQTGSSFKPYVYAIAMENGLSPQSIVMDAPINWGGWEPRNYDRRYTGRIDLTTAFVKSLNTVPVRIAYQHLHRSTKQIVSLIKGMGIESPVSSHKTMVLGTSGMTVMDQATGFNVFANGGIAGNRHGFTQIFSADGRMLWNWTDNGLKLRRVLSEKAAHDLNSMLIQVPIRGTGQRAALPMTRVAGKTGTTQAYRDAWFVGFTGDYTAAVWMGNDDCSSMNRLTGGVVPAMIWQRMMFYMHQNSRLKPIQGIENSLLIASDAVRTNENSRTSPLQDRPMTLSTESLQIIREIATALQHELYTLARNPAHQPEKWSPHVPVSDKLTFELRSEIRE
ncbi:MAG: penicillin-binding protein 1A [Candidatus Tokpelaia sp. JSC085]|nr:MAG: penicillin-binding protein 1A [Candidatus Tokpelaia sp. JSC085]